MIMEFGDGDVGQRLVREVGGFDWRAPINTVTDPDTDPRGPGEIEPEDIGVILGRGARSSIGSTRIPAVQSEPQRPGWIGVRDGQGKLIAEKATGLAEDRRAKSWPKVDVTEAFNGPHLVARPKVRYPPVFVQPIIASRSGLMPGVTPPRCFCGDGAINFLLPHPPASGAGTWRQRAVPGDRKPDAVHEQLPEVHVTAEAIVEVTGAVGHVHFLETLAVGRVRGGERVIADLLVPGGEMKTIAGWAAPSAAPPIVVRPIVGRGIDMKQDVVNVSRQVEIDGIVRVPG